MKPIDGKIPQRDGANGISNNIAKGLVTKGNISTLSEYRQQITGHHQQAQLKAGEAVQHAIEAGRLLNAAKSEVKYGDWLQFVKQAGISARKAQSHMQLANNADRLKNAESAHLSINQALKYLSSPNEKADPLDDFIAPNLDFVVQFYPEIKGVHPVCRAFPLLPPNQFREFVKSIIEHGLIIPLSITPDGLLIDGKIRLLACYLTRTDIRIEAIETCPLSYSISMNLMRTSLTQDQRTAIAVQASDG